MAVDVASVIYATRTNNQPRFGCNWCRSNRQFRRAARVVNGFAV